MRTSIFIIIVFFFSHFTQAQFRTGGVATFYGGVDGGAGGNCGIIVKKGDKMHCAINDVDYKNSEACGAFVEVIGPKGRVVLQVVDRCPECPKKKVEVTVNGKKKKLPVHLDLTQEAFAKIGNLINGAEPIKWRFVANPKKTQKIKYRFKSGSTIYWTGIQVFDTKHAVKKVEYFAKSKNRWVTMVRQPFNFFFDTSGAGSTTIKLRITSVKNQIVLLNNITINGNENKVFFTGRQFGDKKVNRKIVKGESNIKSDFFETNTTVVSSELMYPNPSTNVVHLNKRKPVKWSLFTVDNKKIKSGFSEDILLDNVPKGRYFVKFENKDKTQILIKK